jgi:hypothetical protein
MGPARRWIEPPSTIRSFPLPVLKSNLFDLRRIDESFEIDNLWIALIWWLPCTEHEGGGTVGADCVSDKGVKGAIDVVAG